MQVKVGEHVSSGLLSLQTHEDGRGSDAANYFQTHEVREVNDEG